MIVCFAENPSECWIKHHKEFTDRIVVVKTEDQVIVEFVLAKQEGYESVGRKYGVSSNAIRKWLNIEAGE